MSDGVEFGLFDREAGIEASRRNLPHWFQPNVAVFVTFRTAVQINKELKRQKAFWQSEPFDHLVRSADQFEYLQRYIAENGSEANLSEIDYLFWKR